MYFPCFHSLSLHREAISSFPSHLDVAIVANCVVPCLGVLHLQKCCRTQFSFTFFLDRHFSRSSAFPLSLPSATAAAGKDTWLFHPTLNSLTPSLFTFLGESFLHYCFKESRKEMKENKTPMFSGEQTLWHVLQASVSHLESRERQKLTLSLYKQHTLHISKSLCLNLVQLLCLPPCIVFFSQEKKEWWDIMGTQISNHKQHLCLHDSFQGAE